MHNMIVEDCHSDLSIDDEDDEIHVPDTQAGPENNNAPENLLFLGFVESQFMDTAWEDISDALAQCVAQMSTYVCDEAKSLALRQALINHLWRMCKARQRNHTN